MTALLRLSAGLIAWAVGFCVVYGLHGIVCATSTSGARTILVAAWVLTVAVNLAIAWWLVRTARTPLDRVAVATGWVGVAASLVSFAPVAIVPTCA